MSETGGMLPPWTEADEADYRRLIGHLDTCRAYTLDIECPWLKRYRDGETPDPGVCPTGPAPLIEGTAAELPGFSDVPTADSGGKPWTA